jgi:hypothetical protein
LDRGIAVARAFSKSQPLGSNKDQWHGLRIAVMGREAGNGLQSISTEG